MMDNAKERKEENIEDLKKKVHQSWYEDGLFEISFGICYLIVGLMFVSPIMRFLHGSRISIVFLRLIVVLAIVGGSFLLIRKLKEKVVWNRTGYSARRDYNPKMVLILAFVIFLFFGFYHAICPGWKANKIFDSFSDTSFSCRNKLYSGFNPG